MSILRTTPDLQQHTSLFQSIVLIIAACIVHGVMQGVHDNYGIMMTGLIPCTGIDYVSISFCIGVGAFFSAYLGGFFVDIGVGYGPLWLVNLCLAAIASTASFRIRNENERIEYKGEF